MSDQKMTAEEQLKDFEDFIKRELLNDICFDITQIKQLREIYSTNVYSPTRYCYEEMIDSIKLHMKGLRNEYDRRFGTKLTHKDIERAFKRYTGVTK